MSANLRLVLFFVPFALLVAALGYWNIDSSTPDNQHSNAQAKKTIDLFAQGTQTLQFTDEGTIQYELSSPHLEHTQDDDITVLLQPDLLLFRGTDLPWHISSERSEVSPEGKEVEFSNPREAQEAGIVIVHQELNMMNHLTVAQNIFIGREMMNGKLSNDSKMNEEARKLFRRLNIDIDPTEKMGNLTA